VAASRAEKGYQRYAWIFLFATGIFLVIYGIAHVVLGLTGGTEGGKSLTQLGASGPAADYIKLLTVEKGVFGLVAAVLVIGITLTSYRKGQRWAWFVLWSPVGLAVVVSLLYGIGPPALILVVLSIPGLLLPFRIFFPSRAAAPDASDGSHRRSTR
jgi:hypothetical protein